jgi:RimJ/RimL family protein N-acetyltransferase
VDHHRHEALVAYDAGTGEAAGTARFVRLPDDPGAAEVALTIIDEWQGVGVGTELMTRLVDRAREEGVTQFVGHVLAENGPMLLLLARIGHTERRPEGSGTVAVRGRLADAPLRAAA